MRSNAAPYLFAYALAATAAYLALTGLLGSPETESRLWSTMAERRAIGLGGARRADDRSALADLATATEGDIAPPGSALRLRALARGLDDQDAPRRHESEAALDALVASADRAEVARLASALSDASDGTVRAIVLALLGRGDQGLRLLEAVLGDADAQARVLNVRWDDVVKAARERWAATFGAALRREDSALSRLALRGLRAVGQAARSEEGDVARAVGSDDPDVRALAATTLSEIGPRGGASLAALSRAVRDPIARVRCAAVTALGSVEATETWVVSSLLGALADDEAQVREAASRALGRLGPAASGALDPLERARFDTDPRVAAAAAQAVLEIRGP